MGTKKVYILTQNIKLRMRKKNLFELFEKTEKIFGLADRARIKK